MRDMREGARPFRRSLWLASLLTAVWIMGTAPVKAVALNDGLLLLDGGTFTMGSPLSERQRQDDEMLHEVTVSAFYVDPYEVTQQDYAALMGKNPSTFSGDRLPVEGVSWYDAIAYCNALSTSRGLKPAYIIEGRDVMWDRSADGYRLLTEAEWEYAARAGRQTIFYEGAQITSDHANFEGTYPYLIEENYVSRHNPEVVQSRNRATTIAVDSLSPNAFGLYNMEGNVSEWVFDYYGPYDIKDNVDPHGPLSGSLRVNRGGGWNDSAKQLRLAYRSVTTPATVEQNLGFRIARNAASQSGIVKTVYDLKLEHKADPKLLVAYFSWTGNTRGGAEFLAQRLNADLFEITMAQPYTGNIYEASQRDLNANARPSLAAKVPNIADYDMILLGYPTWWSTMPMPLFTCLETHDLSGKIILPFSSNGGTRFGDSISDLRKHAQRAYVAQGFEYYYSGGSELEDELLDWVRRAGIEL